MKRILFLLSLMLSMTAMAQESIPQDTTVYINGRKININEQNGKIKVKMFNTNALKDSVEDVQVFEGVYLDGRSIERSTIISTPFSKTRKNAYHFEPHYPVFYFGFNKSASNAFRYSSSLPQINSKSWEWGINLCNSGVPITSDGHWGITSALGFARIVYKLDDNYGIEKIDGITVYKPASGDIEYDKSWLRYWTFRLPISLEWQTRFGSGKAFVSTGIEAEWRTGIVSKAKYNGKKHTLSDELNTNPLGLNLLIQAGYRNFGFYSRFGLTPLFEKEKGPKLYPSSIGFGFSWYW